MSVVLSALGRDEVVVGDISFNPSDILTFL
jgi:hypothetical protein